MRNQAASKVYGVGALARLSGVSVRTLHHYHAIGLLVPASIGRNGYRQYGREELLRLQQILFHRRLGMSLEAIAAVLDAPDFDRLASLRAQRRRVADEREHLGRLLTTIDRTIAELEGGSMMSDKDLYGGLSPAKQADYEQWIVDRYGEEGRDKVEAGKAWLAEIGPDGQKAHLEELAAIERDLAAAFEAGLSADDGGLEAILRRHHAWVSRSWGKPADSGAYAGLGELYAAHPDFVARYDRLAAGMTPWLCAAMKHFARQSLGADGERAAG